MKHILLDTNAYCRFLDGDISVFDAIGNAETIYMSIFVIGELLTGFKVASKEKDNLAILDLFLKRSTVKILNATFDTAVFFASIKEELRQKGKPIPINDIWIAAHAMESGSMIITYDMLFKNISNLIVWPSI